MDFEIGLDTITSVMTTHFRTMAGVFSAIAAVAASASAQYSTPPASASEKEATYIAAIEKRASDILNELALSDAAKSNKVFEVILGQYKALRARDEAIDAKLKK